MPQEANSLFKEGSEQTVYLGLGGPVLHNDFDDYGQSTYVPLIGYYYGRHNKVFPNVEFHTFKESYKAQSFSSTALDISIGYNFYSFDSFLISSITGLGFYLPKAKRNINGVIIETDSKVVFGTTLGLEAFMILNKANGIAFRYQYHNPFDLKQTIGETLEGHYTILSINFSQSF